MFDWLDRAWSWVAGHAGSAVADGVHLVTSGLLSLVRLVFGNVTFSWHDLCVAMDDLRHGASDLGSAVWGHLRVIDVFWLGHLLATCWHYLTHPSLLARLLLYPMLAWVEREAMTAARYLGEFVLHLVLKQLRPLLHLAETIAAAVL